MATYRILFLGDVVGKPGRNAVREALPSLQDTHRPLFSIANGENAAGGVGITPEIADELFATGLDAITLGNHAFNKRDIYPYLESGKPIVRPGNMPDAAPGRGLAIVERDAVRLAVMNLCGRVFLEGFDDPFRTFDRLFAEAATPHVFLDFHAEATSEKIAMAYHCEGRASVVAGTHTHVPTADERVLPGGTATITDVGMCGPENGVIGMDRGVVVERFRTSLPARFVVADGPGVICGVVIDVERENGRAVAIERLRFETHH
jgi:metallophosphoesterase (TIGR00282 family)